MILKEKVALLRSELRAMESVIVAFSGGIDSALLAKLAYEELDNQAIAVTGISKTYKAAELEEAQKTAQSIGIDHILIHTNELDNPDFLKNPTNRCFYCKSELFKVLLNLARDKKCNHVIEGSNYDDLSDFRPGMQASDKMGIIKPYLKVKMTKADIRETARQSGLSIWNKPASPCLSSRIPYGTPIATKSLEMIEQGENILKNEGLSAYRVRHHGEIARIEVTKKEFGRLIAHAEHIVQSFQKIGYKYITMDLQGFRSGSLNETLPKKVLTRF